MPSSAGVSKSVVELNTIVHVVAEATDGVKSAASVPPSVQLPGNSCLTVRVTADLRDLSGRSAEPAKFIILTQEGVSTPINITETFSSNAQQEPVVSGGQWGGAAGPGARPGLIGGDGRHGSFDPTLGNPVGGNTFEWNTDLFVIPQSVSLTGQEYTITDGRFFFTDFSVPEGTTVRFTGTVAPVIRVRGDVNIAEWNNIIYLDVYISR